MSQRLKTLHQLITHKIRSWNGLDVDLIHWGWTKHLIPKVTFLMFFSWIRLTSVQSLWSQSDQRYFQSTQRNIFFFLTRTHQQPIRVQTCPRRKKTLCVNMSEYFQCYCTSPQVEVQYVVPPWMWVYDFSVESHYIFSFQPQNSKFWIWKKYNLSQVLYQI